MNTKKTTFQFTTQDLELIVDEVTNLMIPKVRKKDPISPMVFRVRIWPKPVKVKISPTLDPSVIQDPKLTSLLLDAEFQFDDVHAVCFVQEAWLSPHALGSPEEIQRRYSHLTFVEKNDSKKAEVLVINIRTPDFETVMIQGIRRVGDKRIVNRGLKIFEGLSVGGEFARPVKTLH